MDAAAELDITDDLLVAGVAAGCTIALTAALKYGLGLDASLVARLAPLYVYFLYVFSRKGGPYGRYDTPAAWSVLLVAVTAGTALFYVATG
ncbi:hypothetical protein [Halegenticoccus tardaugens]|uniref:hypothetical protein n=1 Tax=Halegenticoccus tardaugens TaxID=2071624 RepID=UPI00100ACB88|nr:hypothetical protein [Halegenticoccus tardaugens]